MRQNLTAAGARTARRARGQRPLRPGGAGRGGRPHGTPPSPRPRNRLSLNPTEIVLHLMPSHPDTKRTYVPGPVVPGPAWLSESTRPGRQAPPHPARSCRHERRAPHKDAERIRARRAFAGPIPCTHRLQSESLPCQQPVALSTACGGPADSPPRQGAQRRRPAGGPAARPPCDGPSGPRARRDSTSAPCRAGTRSLLPRDPRR